jgi:hypothetical protein
MASVDQTEIKAVRDGTISPTLFFFQPKQIWVMAYQTQGWPYSPPSDPTFSYMVSTTPTNANAWFGASALSHVGPAEQVPSSPTLIADNTTMYLFWTTIFGGSIYWANMPIDDFPGVFTTQSEVVMSSWPGALTGSIQVYTVKGNDQYLMILDVRSNEGRYLTSYTATSLNGS